MGDYVYVGIKDIPPKARDEVFEVMWEIGSRKYPGFPYNMKRTREEFKESFMLDSGFMLGSENGKFGMFTYSGDPIDARHTMVSYHDLVKEK